METPSVARPTAPTYRGAHADRKTDVSAPDGIIDPDTGLPRVLRSKCPTCIYRPGNLMHLHAGRREEMEHAAVANGTWIICHSTLKINPDNPGWQAICRGFYDVRGPDSWCVRLAVALGGPVEVDLPDTTHTCQEKP